MRRIVLAALAGVAATTVALFPSSELQITAFDFPGVVSATYFDHAARALRIHVPFGTELSELTPEITHNGKEVARKSGGTGFEGVVEYEIRSGSWWGASERYRVEVIAHHWELLTASPGWKPRDGSGLLSFKGALWLLGGWEAPDMSSAVWRSEDGRTWKHVTDAPWPPRHNAGWVVFDDKMWVISGDELSDVWSSKDGIHWTEETSAAPFGSRYSPYVAAFNNRLWLMGGLSWKGIYPGATAFNDVWSSIDGRTWRLELAHAPWAPRAMIHGAALLGDKLFIMGGGIKAGVGADRGTETVSEYNDVWSTRDGKTWNQEIDRASWRPRTHFSVATTPKYIYITDGSVRFQNSLSNEVWRTQNGRKWELVSPTPWSGRHASSLSYHDGKLYISSGYLVNDVWAMKTE